VNYSANDSKLEASANGASRAVSLESVALEVGAGGNVVAVLSREAIRVFRAKTLEPLHTITLEAQP
jgi:hypothetical protein